MTSWRDEADPVLRDQLDELLDVAIRAAQHQLDATGAFYPFAVALDGAGGTRVLTPEVRTGPREVADVATVFEACWTALTAEAEGLAAAAVASDVGGPDGDAIAVALEHRDGPAIEVFLPYAAQGKTNGKKPAQKHLYGDLQAAPGQPRVWGGEAAGA
jgi:hypothetical protein